MLDLLRAIAAETGERVLAVHADRIGMATREAIAPSQATAGAVAYLSLTGPLTPKGMRSWGRDIGTSMAAFRSAIGQAAANPDYAAIVIDVDSPGGTVAGTPETGAAVRAAAGVKPVIAVADTLMASAAYWIGSQASELVVAPSAEVGSIGVIAVHMEMSKMLEEWGINTTIIRSRPGKADVNPYEPLTPEALAHLESSIAAADAEFLKVVAQGRKTTVANVRDTFGGGRLVDAREAVKLGMADRVATMSDVLAGLIRTRTPPRRRSAGAFI